MNSISIIAATLSLVATCAAVGGSFQVNVYQYGCGDGYVTSTILDDSGGWTSCTYWNPSNAWYLNIVDN
jgi:hypothetical protein